MQANVDYIVAYVRGPRIKNPVFSRRSTESSEQFLDRLIQAIDARVGTVVVLPDGSYGYSFAHPTDDFNKKLGTEIALGRALAHQKYGDDHKRPQVPYRHEATFEQTLQYTKERAQRAFVSKKATKPEAKPVATAKAARNAAHKAWDTRRAQMKAAAGE